ncbi:MFS transporter [Salegentibacter salinarum]|uniref:MFS transporter n=1 Tax=Salegentibacter salinarum TaxID=447422 RepID=A0A2N0TY35_9FLAO|nr:MFS transporter [Salegentibacter salinarum]PKD19654.1 MFS transporter [Salegentibacter salinarum]SKB91017.1 MFS transporter, NNP family, nitrate/nitrite transporter [Salegentibacter salinarum]
MKDVITGKATKLDLRNLRSIPIRTFWISAIAFFICFFSWFGIVPFMPQVEKDLGLSPSQKWNAIILAVSGTVFARLLIGKLCDKYGPRLCYTWLLMLGAIPTILCGLVQTPLQFQLCRLFMGFIGASFVITQVHTSLMFASNVVGTANATSAGWGNLGGGANRLGMPLIAAALVAFGVAEAEVWRYAMVVAGLVCFSMGFVYYFFTQDTPEGNFSDLKKSGKRIPVKKDQNGFLTAIKDYRVWILFVVYGVCFGIELTVYGTMDSYLQNTFNLERVTAGNIILGFALMNLFARTLGGYFGDKSGEKGGLRGRVFFLTLILIAEGVILSLFSMAGSLIIAIILLTAFSLAVQMAEGATFAVVPFINKKAIGSISGIVGAGGNVGAFLAALFLKIKSVAAEEAAIAANEGRSSEIIESARASASSAAISDAFLWIGFSILAAGLVSLAIRFSQEDEKEAALELNHQNA